MTARKNEARKKDGKVFSERNGVTANGNSELIIFGSNSFRIMATQQVSLIRHRRAVVFLHSFFSTLQ